MIAPLQGALAKGVAKRWEGAFSRKPWDYNCTAVIPHIETPEILALCVGLLRLLENPPYLHIIDTGSSPETIAWIEHLRGADCEIHYIRSHGYVHPSDPVAIAMDLAMMLCQTRWMFTTHADCFLKRRDLIETMIGIAGKKQSPCVGYQLSPRKHADWEWMVGHTCTLLDVPFLDAHDITWSQRRLCRQRGIEWSPDVCLSRQDGQIRNPAEQPNWPDTELALNYGLDRAGQRPILIGSEENYVRNNNPDFDHVRSYPSMKLFMGDKSPKRKQSEAWMAEAIADAKARIALWTQERSQKIRGTDGAVPSMEIA